MGRVMPKRSMSEPPDEDGGSAGSEQNTYALAPRLAAALARKGWTLARAAREVSGLLPEGETFHAANLSHYLQGRSMPRPHYRDALVRALDLGDVPDEVWSRADRRRTRGGDISRAPETPFVRVADLQDGTARLQVDQVLPWPQVLEVLQVLKRDDRSDGDE